MKNITNKINLKRINMRIKAVAVLALFSAISSQACWTTLPDTCVNYFSSGSCGEGQGSWYDYSSDADFKNVCADAGSHTYNTAQTCGLYWYCVMAYCTWTDVYVACDGSTTDTPESSGYCPVVLTGSCAGGGGTI
jgi:hypothetical protein